MTSLAVGAFLATQLAAEDFTCPGGAIVVQSAGDHSEAICRVASEATRQLASCNLTVPSPITVEVTHEVPSGCYGLYHCGDHLIQLRPVGDYAAHLSSAPQSLFAHVEPDVFFESILRHEMVHAVLEATHCPFDSCPATQEFVAYTMQIMFLPDIERAPFDQRLAEVSRPVTRDSVNAIILMWSPETFMTNAYAYLMQQNDPCALIGAIAQGEVVFDLPF